MNRNFKWEGTDLVLDEEVEDDIEIIQVLKNEGISFRDKDIEDSKCYLRNQKRFFILEDEFIKQSTNIISIIRKLVEKDFESSVKVYDRNENKFVQIESSSCDKKLYENILSRNIMTGSERNLEISINILNEVLCKDKSKLFIDILILFALAHKTTYTAENVKCEFINDDKHFYIDLNLLSSEPLYLWPLYDWVFNGREYKDSHTLKLKIVRRVILNRKNLDNIEDILIDSKITYRRIISQKTDDYFEELNRLKDDYLILSKNIQGSVRVVNITFFTWLGTLGIEVFKIAMAYEGDELWEYLFWAKDDKIVLLVIISLVALCIIALAYYREFKCLQSEYRTIKNIYKDKIFLQESDVEFDKFSDLILEPSISNVEKYTFILLFLLLFVRLYISVR